MSSRGWNGIVLIGLALVLAACGGGGGEASGAGAGSVRTTVAPAAGGTSTSEADAEESGSDGEPSAGAVDCAELDLAAEQLASLQYLVLLDSPDNVRAIEAGMMGDLDLDQFLEAMRTLHQLDTTTGALGDPKAAIDEYERVALAARKLFAVEPLTQAQINVYQDELGDAGGFLVGETAILGALAEAGC